MRRELILALALAVGVAVLTGVAAGQGTDGCGFPYETSDAYGETVVEEEPDSVVTLAPSVTQTIWEMDAQEKVAGIESNSFYLEGTDGFPDVGTVFSPSYPEKVVAQNPDLAIGALLSSDQVTSLEDAGVETHSLQPTGGFEGIYENVNETGRLIGECDAAESVVTEMRRDVEYVETNVEGEPRPSVMYRIPSEGAFVPGDGTFIDEVISTAGGESVYAEAGFEGFTQIPSDETEVEIVEEQNPDWIVLLNTDEGVPSNDLYNGTTAVRRGQVIRVNANYIQQEAPRVTIPLERMARAFHSDAFSDSSDDRNPEIDVGGAGTGAGSSRNGTFEAGLSSLNGTSIAEFGDGPVEAVEVNGDVSGRVTVTSLDAGDSPGLPVRRFSVDVPGATSASGTVRATVGSAALEAAGVEADDLRIVSLNRGTRALDTTAVGTEDGVTLVADTDAFGEFVVVATTPPAAVGEAAERNGTVALDGSESRDEYGEISRYVWTVDGEEYEESSVGVDTDAEEATLTVTNDAGLTNETTVSVVSVNESEDTEEERSTSPERNETAAEGNETAGDGEDDAADDDGQSTPGFTAVAALVALVAVALVLRG